MTLTSVLNTASADSHKDIADRIESSPQFSRDSFTGGQKAFSMSYKTHAEILWRFITEDNQRKPDVPLPGRPLRTPEPLKKGTKKLNSTWLGHSTVLINIDGYHVLTDPVFEDKVSIVGPVKFKRDVAPNFHLLPKIDVVIISHDHYDHLNKDSIQRLAESVDRFIVPLGVGKHLMNWGVRADKVVQLDWWESYRYDHRLTLTATPAQHFSGRGLTDRNKTLWASFVISSTHHNLFFSGDSGYFSGFKEIGERLGPFDMTFLECGAYDLSWHPVHMLPEETVQAHLDLKGNILHPIHWGTFNLALHPWYEPMERLVAASEKRRVRYATPVVGETIDPETDQLGRLWWRHVLNQNRSFVTAN